MSSTPGTAGPYVRVAAVDEIAPGSSRQVDVEGVKICIARTADDAIYAFQDNCSHRDFPLSAGVIEEHTVECAWHGARFDMKTGRAVRLPAIKPIRTYDVKVEDGDILIAVED